MRGGMSGCRWAMGRGVVCGGNSFGLWADLGLRCGLGRRLCGEWGRIGGKRKVMVVGVMLL